MSAVMLQQLSNTVKMEQIQFPKTHSFPSMWHNGQEKLHFEHKNPECLGMRHRCSNLPTLYNIYQGMIL
jgi:hypothetical protein